MSLAQPAGPLAAIEENRRQREAAMMGVDPEELRQAREEAYSASGMPIMVAREASWRESLQDLKDATTGALGIAAMSAVSAPHYAAGLGSLILPGQRETAARATTEYWRENPLPEEPTELDRFSTFAGGLQAGLEGAIRQLPGGGLMLGAERSAWEKAERGGTPPLVQMGAAMASPVPFKVKAARALSRPEVRALEEAFGYSLKRPGEIPVIPALARGRRGKWTVEIVGDTEHTTHPTLAKQAGYQNLTRSGLTRGYIDKATGEFIDSAQARSKYGVAEATEFWMDEPLTGVRGARRGGGGIEPARGVTTPGADLPGAAADVVPRPRVEPTRLFEERPEALREMGVPAYSEQASLVGITKRNKSHEEALALAQEWVESRTQMALKHIEQGMREGGETWYQQSPLYDWLERLVRDPKDAQQVMRQLAANAAATSSGADVPLNARRMLWGTAAQRAGLPIQGLAGKGPGGQQVWSQMSGAIGGQYGWRQVASKLDEIGEAMAAGRDPLSVFDPIGAHKQARYGAALGGNWQNVPVDLHMTRQYFGDPGAPRMMVRKGEPVFAHKGRGGLVLDKSRYKASQLAESPRRFEWEAIEQAHRETLGPQTGLSPSESMAAQWVGGAPTTGIADPRPFIAIVNDELIRLAANVNTTPSDLMKMIVHGEVPKEVLGGAVGLGLFYGMASEEGGR